MGSGGINDPWRMLRRRRKMRLRTSIVDDGREAHAMGEAQTTLFELESNRSVRIRAEAAEALSVNSGALLVRELGQRTGLWALLKRALVDPRDPDRITHPFEELVRTVVLMAAQGWSRPADVDLLRYDPALRVAVSKRRGEGPL